MSSSERQAALEKILNLGEALPGSHPKSPSDTRCLNAELMLSKPLTHAFYRAHDGWWVVTDPSRKNCGASPVKDFFMQEALTNVGYLYWRLQSVQVEADFPGSGEIATAGSSDAHHERLLTAHLERINMYICLSRR